MKDATLFGAIPTRFSGLFVPRKNSFRISQKQSRNRNISTYRNKIIFEFLGTGEPQFV
jgi:hypothetical protein